MLAVVGVLLLASSALTFIWAFGQFRRAAPKPWTTRESISNAVVLAIISLLAFGVGALIKAVISLNTSPISVMQLAIIAAIIAISIVCGRAMRRQAAPFMPAQPANDGVRQADVSALAVAANDPGPGDKPRPVSGRGRRAA